MKMLLIVADAARLEPIRRDLSELNVAGYSVLPMLEGAGRTGLHTGDRAHPGALVTLFVVAAEDTAAGLFDALVHRRDTAGDTVTRLFLLPVERQA